MSPSSIAKQQTNCEKSPNAANAKGVLVLLAGKSMGGLKYLELRDGECHKSTTYKGTKQFNQIINAGPEAFLGTTTNGEWCLTETGMELITEELHLNIHKISGSTGFAAALVTTTSTAKHEE